jgi:hypothetical protein
MSSSPGSGPPGTAVQVTATGFAAFDAVADVSITMRSKPVTGLVWEYIRYRPSSDQLDAVAIPGLLDSRASGSRAAAADFW